MNCPKCHHVNDVTAKYCAECAAPLALACAHCGHQLPPRAKFCPECGQPADVSSTKAPLGSPEAYTPKHLAEKILSSRAALEGERKQVTVLFADLKGSTELMADRDPEEAREAPRSGARADDGGRPPLRGHRQPGAWATASWRCSARRSPTRTTPCGPATPRCGCRRRSRGTPSESCAASRRRRADPRRAQLRRGRGALDRQRPAHGLHRDRPDHAPGRADGAARARPARTLVTAATLALAEGFVAGEGRSGRCRSRGWPSRVEVYELDRRGPGAHAAAGRGARGPHALRRARRRGRSAAPGAASSARATGTARSWRWSASPGSASRGCVCEFTHSHRTRGLARARSPARCRTARPPRTCR